MFFPIVYLLSTVRTLLIFMSAIIFFPVFLSLIFLQHQLLTLKVHVLVKVPVYRQVGNFLQIWIFRSK